MRAPGSVPLALLFLLAGLASWRDAIRVAAEPQPAPAPVVANVSAMSPTSPNQPSQPSQPSQQSQPAASPTSELCQAAACIDLGQLMGNVLSRAAKEINPCDDLYSSVCTGWQKLVEKPKQYARFGMLATIQEKHKAAFADLLMGKTKNLGSSPWAVHQLRALYSQCRSGAFPNPFKDPFIRRRLNKYKGWDLSSTYGLHHALNENMITGAKFLFSVTIDTDPKDSNLMAVWAQQGGLSLQHAKNYIVKASRDALTKLLGEIFRDFKVHGATPEEVLDFEKQLVDISSTPTELRSPHLPRRFTQETALFPARWVRDQAGPKHVIVDSPAFFERLHALLARTPARVLKAYFISAQMQALLAHTDYPPIHEFRHRALHVRRPARGQHCDDALARLAPYLAAHAHLMAIDGGAATLRRLEADVGALVAQLKDRYLNLLWRNQWMSAAQRERTIRKMSEIKMRLIAEPWILDAKQVREYHEQFVPKSTWIATLAWVRLQGNVRIWQKLGRPNERKTVSSPMVANAFYSQPDNRIVIPYGILHPPVYHVDYPLPLKLAGVGMIIAHELTHALDSRGREYDWNGNLNNWWEDEDAKEFLERAKCLTKQYDQYKIQGIPVNGNLTNAENIADNVALRLVTDIVEASKYQPSLRVRRPNGKLMAPKQVFYTQYALTWCAHFEPAAERLSLHSAVHAPSKWRVNGCIANRPEFADTFGCEPRNPKLMCSLW